MPLYPLPLPGSISLLPNYNSLAGWPNKLNPLRRLRFVLNWKLSKFSKIGGSFVCTHILTGSNKRKGREGEGLSTPQWNSAGRRLFCQFEKRWLKRVCGDDDVDDDDDDHDNGRVGGGICAAASCNFSYCCQRSCSAGALCHTLYPAIP